MKEVAWIIYCREYNIEHPDNLLSGDYTISEDWIDRSDFMKNYAEEFLGKYVEEGKEPPKGINEVS